MIKKLMERINRMSAPAYITLKLTYTVSILILAAALVLLLADRSRYLDTARELYSIPQAVLLVGGLVSLVMEDMSS